MRGGHNRKVSPAQRDEMIRLHLSGDFEAARSMALSLGVDRDYAAARASDRYHKPMCNAFPTNRQWVTA